MAYEIVPANTFKGKFTPAFIFYTLQESIFVFLRRTQCRQPGTGTYFIYQSHALIRRTCNLGIHQHYIFQTDKRIVDREISAIHYLPVNITVSQLFPFDFMFKELCKVVLLGIDRRFITNIRLVLFIKRSQRLRTGYAITRHLNADIICSHIGYGHKDHGVAIILFGNILYLKNMIFIVVIANPDTLPCVTVSSPVFIVFLCVCNYLSQYLFGK